MEKIDLEPWLALFFIPGMNLRIYNSLLNKFESPSKILSLHLKALEAIGLKKELCFAIKNYKKNRILRANVDKHLEWSKKDGHMIICLACENYPYLLSLIPDPPPIIFVKGRPEMLSMPQIAMVGSRKPSSGGRKNARKFAKSLVEIGFTICSGMAYGIDYESHCGAIEGKGNTVGVMATGLDNIYPKQHDALAKKIVNNGALISEFALGTLPSPWNFPKRNRIISGLSMGVFVVEAAIRSGSLISANYALEQGREVYAMPGLINNPAVKGCHHLIRHGATLVENIDDITNELKSMIEHQKQCITHDVNENKELIRPQLDLNYESREVNKLISEIDYEVTSVENLVIKTGLEAGKIGALLTELELKGVINLEAGGYALANKD